MGQQKTCAHCGAEFEPRRRGGKPQKYCSALCRDRANRAKVPASYFKEHYAANKARYASNAKAWYGANKERDAATGRAWYAANKERRAVTLKAWYVANPAKRNAMAAHYRALKLRATPPWVNPAELLAIYEGCPEGYHVDHIHPLKGKHSTGLHVPWNLNYLPDTENLAKSNHMPQPGYFDWFSEPWTVHATPMGRVWSSTHYE